MAKAIVVPKVQGVKPRHLAGGSWKRKQIARKGKASQTPGRTKNADTCQLTSVGGLPRKAYTRARGYKLRQYSEWLTFTDGINGRVKA